MSKNIELKGVKVKSEKEDVQDVLKLKIDLKNVGNIAAKKAKGTLRSEDPGIVVTDDYGYYRTLNVNEVDSGAFEVKAQAGAIGQHHLDLDVSYEIGGVLSTERFDIPIKIDSISASDAAEKTILDGLKAVLDSPDGATHRKVDLHVHTPASECCKYDGTPLSFVDTMWKRCIAADVKLIALTDHNSPGYTKLDDIHSPTYYELFRERITKERKKGKDVVEVLPGTELTANGIHILAVFPSQKYATFTIASLLDDLGVQPEEWGKPKTVCTESATRVIEEVTRRGGIAIPAHVDASNGLLKKHPKGQELIKVIEHPDLHGVEYVNGLHPEDIVKKVTSHREGRPLAYLRGSDNHMYPPGEDDMGKAIGERHTWVKMSTPSFTGLKKALQDPGSSLKTSTDSISKGGFTKLLGMTVRGGFADGTTLKFNSDMNCFIGRMGSGKSTRLKLIGKTMDPDLDYELRDEEVHLFFEKVNVPTSEHYYCFRIGSKTSEPHFFKIHKVNKTVVEVQNPDKFGLALPRIYDQDSIDGIVESPSKLLDFITRHYFQDPKTFMDTAYVEKRCKGLTKGGELKAKDKLDKLQTAVEKYAIDKGATLKDKKLNSEIRKELKRLMKAGLLENETVHPPDQLVDLKALAGQIDLIKKDEKKVKNALKGYLQYKHQRKHAELKSFSDVVVTETDRKKVTKALGDVLDQGDISRTTLKKDLVAHSGDDDLGDDLKVFLDNAMIKDLKEVRREYLAERARVILAGEYEVAVGARQKARNRLIEAMKAVPVTPADSTELREAYDRIYSLRTVMAKLFQENFLNEGGDPIITLKIRKGSWDKDLKQGEAADELENMVTKGREAIDDEPELRLRGETRLLKLTEEFKDQRTVATMLILLNNREFGPFIVDEPEEHLDNESVFQHLVPRLRQLKDRQQLIMVTRNANIPLSGDAENIIISRAKNAKLSKIVGKGSLDLKDINEQGATILEGGFGAFNLRNLKYTLFKHGP